MGPEHHDDDVLLTEHSRAFLIVLRGPGQGREHEIKANPTVIGRDEQADIKLPADSVSRRHARINVVDTIYFIQDLDSTNGLKINGTFVKRGTEAALKNEDKIELGDVLLQFFTKSGT